jgi:RNA polymerase sigma factor (sigma-70 family)
LTARDDEAWRIFLGRCTGTQMGLIRSCIAGRNWFLLEGREEEVLQESLVRLLRHIGKFRGTTYQELDSFVARNTVFTCLQELRRIRVVEVSGLAGEAMEEHLAGRWPETSESVAMVREWVAELPEHLRAVMLLDLAGCSAKETAAHLGVKAQTVFDRKHQAVGLLRAKAREWDHRGEEAGSLPCGKEGLTS